MSLQPGTELLHYRIVEKIGAGGMGEVWRATDSTLGRDVALKLLPAAFAQDADRMARFEREAKVLASLNHPEIAGIYGLHEANGLRFLAMELVEGEDLSQRLERGAIPFDEALPLARGIAEALEYAHERGIVHRDLKPANVKVTPEGGVKVLDFGLAKAVAGESHASSASSESVRPTVTSGGTATGVVLGTASYMSPEQARGKPVDRRTDIWSFGVLLYEMLTGEHLFVRETVSDTLAAVLTGEPDWSVLPATVPAAVRRLLARCLERDPRQRLRDIGEARVLLGGSLEPEAEKRGPVAEKRPSWSTAVAMAAVVAIFAFLAARWLPDTPIAPPRDAVVADIAAPEDGTWSLDESGPGPVAVSPDGRRMAFGVARAGQIELWIRALDSSEMHLIPQSEGAQYPFWSPDGTQVAFFARSQLWISELEDPRPVALATAPDGKGGTWNRDGVIVYTPNASEPISSVEVATGERRVLTDLTEGNHRSHRHPRFLADGRRFLFLARGVNDIENRVMLGSLDSDTVREVLHNGSQAELVRDRLLWVDNGFLYSRKIDIDALEFEGEREVVARDVLEIPSAAFGAFSASLKTLAFHRGAASHSVQLVWLDPTGSTDPTFEPLVGLQSQRLSPDGRNVVAVITDPTTRKSDLWVLDLTRGVKSRLTSGDRQEYEAVWSEDGKSVFFSADASGNYNALYRISLRGGDETVLLSLDDDLAPEDVSPDGRWLLYRRYQAQSGSDLHVFSLAGDGERRPLAASEFIEILGRFSPDGQWISFVSNETGRWELYVTPFPAMDRKWRVSRDGAYMHDWFRDSRSLLYLDIAGAAFRVGIRLDGTEPHFDEPRLILQMPPGSVGNTRNPFDIGPDDRILSVEGEASYDSTRLSLLLDWLL